FLNTAQSLGLLAIVRPGPHINAELTYFGIPERVIWNQDCQARSPRGKPVVLPVPPLAFPVPSYASEAFHDETARWFRAVGAVVAPRLHPAGPVVLVQVDNEGALYFRDGAYDQDYHPDAVARFRAFVREKYGSLEALAEAYGPPPAGDEEARFATLAPPTRFDAKGPGDLARHLDWAEFHEELLASAFTRFSRALEAAGIEGVPTSHNLPPGQDATPLNPARVAGAVDLVGIDYYHPASEPSRAIIARRTTELASRCEGLAVPAFGAEMGAGFPPFFPPLDARDNAFALMTALAYGLRAFNLYMAVERDRWIGAPIDRRGRARPSASFFRRLTRALDASDFFSLTRRAPVRVLIPRRERRIARAMHAFGPVTGAFFSVAGEGPRTSASEEELGLGHPIGIESDLFARAFEEALDARGVPFASIGGEDRDVSLDGARWIVCATSGGLKLELFDRLADAVAGGARVSIGPRFPTLAGHGLVGPRADLTRLLPGHVASGVPLLVTDDPAAAAAAVAAAVTELALPTYACEPASVRATVHHDRAGAPRVLFLVNGGEADCVARVALGAEIAQATDLLDGDGFAGPRGVIDVRIAPRTVRMLALA
ncbi:MAG TPA: beta-galactosidase, partial [Byssovorax sp.]